MDDLPLLRDGQAGDVLASAAGVVGAVLSGTLLGILLGIVLAVVLFFLLRRLGCYGAKERVAGWVRGLILVFTILAFAILGGIGGFVRGGVRGVETQVKEGPLGKTILLGVGEVGADFMLMIQDKALIAGALPQMEELDVENYLNRVETLKKEVIEQVAQQLKAAALAKNPDWLGGTGEKILDWIITRLAKSVVDKAINKKVGEEFFNDLQAVARNSRKPGFLSRAELADFLGNNVLYSALARPLRAYGRNVTMLLGGIGVVALAIPPGLIWLCSRRRPSSTPKSSVP